jgi:HlyD family secretion protein
MDTAGAKAAAKSSSDKKAETVKVVFVVEQGKAHQRQVATGISDETHVELTSGVKPGEQLVTGPYRTLKDLKDGDAVTLSKTSEEEDRKTGTAQDSAKKG